MPPFCCTTCPPETLKRLDTWRAHCAFRDPHIKSRAVTRGLYRTALGLFVSTASVSHLRSSVLCTPPCTLPHPLVRIHAFLLRVTILSL